MSAEQRILLVDDDPGSLATILPALQTQGYDIATASGTAALEPFAPHRSISGTA